MHNKNYPATNANFYSDNFVPGPADVERYLNLWADLHEMKAHEDALHRLFSARNNFYLDESDLLLKCSCLNDFYSTNIFKVYFVVRHYMAVDEEGRQPGGKGSLAERLAAGDLTLVEDLRHVPVGYEEAERDYFSFATKFCSHHEPQKYPIYDRYVDRMLKHFSKKDRRFATSNLKNYGKFVTTVDAFRDTYGLQQYGYREIDHFLWQYGKEHEWYRHLLQLCRYYQGEEQCPDGCRSVKWWALEQQFVHMFCRGIGGREAFDRFRKKHLESYRKGYRKELWSDSKQPVDAAMVVYAMEELSGKWYPYDGEDAVLDY